MVEKTEKTDKKESKIKSKKLTLKEYEKKVLELADKMTAEKIGETLRKEGIHPKEHDKKISKILKEAGKYTSPDLQNVENKLSRIKSHYESNKQDKRAKREKDRIFSQVRRIKKYLGIEIKRR